jgi:hypothetical protein
MAAQKKQGSKKILKYSLLIIVVLLVLIQFVPIDRTNPPVVREPNWDSPQTRAYAVRACFDCHSNETKWPAYSYIAPISWLVADDVEEGRKDFNMSDWKPGKGDEAAKEVRKGDMPMWQYALMHSEAKLTDAEKKEFIAGLIATFGEKKEGSQKEKRDKSVRFTDDDD